MKKRKRSDYPPEFLDVLDLMNDSMYKMMDTIGDMHKREMYLLSKVAFYEQLLGAAAKSTKQND